MKYFNHLCGIAGIWTNKTKAKAFEELADRMVGEMKLRGPDATGVHCGANMVLGHTRLSIIDLDPRSNQPMHDYSGRYSLVFNGEIYNYTKLKSELESSSGIKFRTSSDTEVLLYGLITEGSDFLKRLNGFFALGFYDNQEDSLMIARDRFGIKPLYYCNTDQGFAFASALGALRHFFTEKTIDSESLFAYLQLSYIPAPRTIYKQAFKLEPGSFARISAGGIHKESFYSLPETQTDTGQSTAGLTGEFASLLRASVKKRLVADVPVGTFLSGGLDSSVITKLAAEENPNLPAFSIGFPDQPFFDETDRAAAIAKHLGLDHHIINLTEKDIDASLEEVLDAIDEPFADSSALLVNLLSREAGKEVKVILSGDGADEILGGYNKHRALFRSTASDPLNRFLKSSAGAMARVPESRNNTILNRLRKLKRYSSGLGVDFEERYLAWASFTPSALVQQLLLEPTSPQLGPFQLNEADFNSVLRADLKLVLPNDMLFKVDLMSMHRSLEVRVPFLDHELVDFLFKLPARHKLDRNKGKILLRETFENQFPANFFKSAKKGFEAPLAQWIKGPLKPLCTKYFANPFLKEQGIFNPEVVEDIYRKSTGKFPGDSPHTVWALLVFQHWYVKAHLSLRVD